MSPLARVGRGAAERFDRVVNRPPLPRPLPRLDRVCPDRDNDLHRPQRDARPEPLALTSPAPQAPLSKMGPFLTDGGCRPRDPDRRRCRRRRPRNAAFRAVHEGLELSHICCPPKAAGKPGFAGR